MRRAAIAISCVVALVAGCTTATRYRLPYTSPQMPTAWPCVQQCENQAGLAESSKRESLLTECVAKCDGVIFEDGACRVADLPPYGYCRQGEKQSEVGEFGYALLGGAVLGVLVVLYFAYAYDKHMK